MKPILMSDASDLPPKVTVVLPTYNRGKLVCESARSVLTQSFGDLELLVIDDGSSEDLAHAMAEILEDSRVRLIRHDQNKGAAAARNTGSSLARGEYVAFIDSDDLWYADKLLRQLAWMQSNERPVSCTGYRLVNSFRPEGESRLSPEVGLHNLHWGCATSPGSTMMVERALFERVGRFDESLRRLEDWEWLLRCAQTTPIGVVPEILAVVRDSSRFSYPWEDVRDAAAILRGYVLAGRYPLDRRKKRILQASLHSEVAAAAYRRGRYGAAAASLLKSHYYYPLKRISYYRRIARAVTGDLRSFASRAEFPPARNGSGQN